MNTSCRSEFTPSAPLALIVVRIASQPSGLSRTESCKSGASLAALTIRSSRLLFSLRTELSLYIVVGCPLGEVQRGDSGCGAEFNRSRGSAGSLDPALVWLGWRRLWRKVPPLENEQSDQRTDKYEPALPRIRSQQETSASVWRGRAIFSIRPNFTKVLPSYPRVMR